MESFFKYERVKLLGDWAHPLSTYTGGYYVIEEDKVTVLIEYKEGKTQVTLTRSGSYFSNLRVDYDDFGALWRPFTGLAIIKEILSASLQESQESESFASQLERAFGKRIEDMTGTELALFAINVEWFTY